MATGSGGGLTRRAVLRGGGALGLAVFVPFGRIGPAAASVGVAAVEPGSGFLTEPELETLRAFVDRLIPSDVDPGAVAAGCAEAIDGLLSAFQVDPPRIYAGGPFSDRAGSSTNHFAEFLPLDAYEAKGWRLRIEGSRGRPELEFNGPVPGFQTIYRQGLAALDDAAPAGSFAALPAPAAELLLRTTQDEDILELVDVAFPHTLEFMYGAPEYGGNRDLVGWELTGYDGDVQPRGWTREEVEQPDRPGGSDPLRTLPLPPDELLPMVALTSAEQAHGMVSRSGGRLRGLQREADAILRAQQRYTSQLAELRAAAAEVARTTAGGDRGR
jgi:hypothetical protein